VTKASSSRKAITIWPRPRILFKLPVSNTDSVGFNGNGASRAGAEAMFQKLGISEEIKPKIKLVKGSAPDAAARGKYNSDCRRRAKSSRRTARK
jgi:hypothetical protein